MTKKKGAKRKAKARKINAKQTRFVEEYLVDGNATRAALAAGYSPRTAHSQGHRLLKNVLVAAALEQRQGERAKRAEITADEILMELVRLGFDMEEETRDRLKALELAGKHLGMFKTIISGDPDAPLVPNRPMRGLPEKQLRHIIAANKLLEKIANDSGD